jgi:hypothetical protein
MSGAPQSQPIHSFPVSREGMEVVSKYSYRGVGYFFQYSVIALAIYRFDLFDLSNADLSYFV